jgi:hypothetical protein
MTEQLGDELDRQEESLTDLGSSIDQLSDALPTAGRTASRLVQLTRLAVVLVGLIVTLHGLSVVTPRLRRSRQAEPAPRKVSYQT